MTITIHDPTAGTNYRPEGVVFVRDPATGLNALRSPVTGQWFIHNPWNSSSTTLELADDDSRACVQRTIVVEELAEELRGRCDMVRVENEPLRHRTLTERHDYDVRMRAFAKVTTLGYSSAEVLNAYESLDLLKEFRPKLGGIHAMLVQNVPTPTVESAEDPHVLKAIFVAGAGGAGKSKIAKSMFDGTGLRYISTDEHLERIMREADEPLDRVGVRYDLFRKARDLRNKQLQHFGSNRAGIVVDVTGWELSRVLGPLNRLRALGYDASMIFVRTKLETALKRNRLRERKVPDSYVETAWRGSLRNLPTFFQAFGHQNLLVIDNDHEYSDADWAKKVEPELHRIGQSFLRRPISNKNGIEWLERHRGEL